MKLLHGTLFVRRFTVDVRSICESVGVDWNGSSDSVICSDNIDIVYHAFFLAMKDYTLDSQATSACGQSLRISLCIIPMSVL